MRPCRSRAWYAFSKARCEVFGAGYPISSYQTSPHSRAGGKPVAGCKELGPRLRGDERKKVTTASTRKEESYEEINRHCGRACIGGVLAPAVLPQQGVRAIRAVLYQRGG